MEIIRFKITIYLVIKQNILKFSCKSRVHENEHCTAKAQCVSWFIETKSDIRLKFCCAWMSDFISKPGNTLGFFLQNKILTNFENCNDGHCVFLNKCPRSIKTHIYKLFLVLLVLEQTLIVKALFKSIVLYIVGGIYTVIRSKAQSTVEELGEDYCLVGICNEKYVAMEVDKMELSQQQLKRTVDSMRRQQIGVFVAIEQS